MTALLAVAVLAAATPAVLRWLRVAQREHYLPAATRFAVLWWRRDPVNLSLVVAALAGVALASVVTWASAIPVLVATLGPVGLGVRGRTSPLAWTGRLRRLAIVTAVLTVASIGAGWALSMPWLVALVPLVTPAIVDLALLLVAPYERRAGEVWIERAAAALDRIDPTIVAITGSYGKTSTKNLVAHLLGGRLHVVASPASFNNRMGLARAVNEHLTPGTQVFVAEMGTYGPGEIRELCSWIPPDVAVITALGPVHLERMGDLETIAAAKREILEHAPVAVISIDHPLLATMAGEESAGRRVVTVTGEGREADVVATPDGRVTVSGAPVGRFDPASANPGNVACAVGVLTALGVDPASVEDLLGDLPEVAHRRSVGRSERGFEIVDDTFNANPAGARSALGVLERLGSDSGRRVVVTPGMVELGGEQGTANRAFMRGAAAAGVTHVVVVNRTNRAELVAGAEAAGIGAVIVCESRDEAVGWVRENLGPGDAVLYENDLPDHYP